MTDTLAASSSSSAPVEFDPISSTFFDDPYPTYRRLRDEAPAYFNERYGFWALSRHEDVVAAHRDWQTFSSTHGLTLDQLHADELPANLRSMIMQDPPEHDRMRKLVSRVFSPKAVAELEPMARRIIAGYLADALADGRGAFDAVAQYSAPFPVEVISTMLGVPDGDRQQIRHWTDDLLHREPGVIEPTQAGMEAGFNMGVYFYELAQEKRRRPDDSMLCQLTQVEVVRDDDGTMTSLTNEEIAGFATLLAGAGSETVTKLVGGDVVLFGRNPSEWQKVLDDADRIANAIEEILRYWPPSQYQGCFSMRDSQWHGQTIPAGMPVLLLTGAATHDERAFSDPDRFDIDRPAQLNVGFGHGIHMCLGAFLARMESRIAFEELRERAPRFDVDEDGLRRVHMSNVAGYSNVPVRVVV